MRVGLLTYGLDRPLSGVTRVALELGRTLQHREDCDVLYLTPYRNGPFRKEDEAASVFLPGCRLLPGLMLLGGPLLALVARRWRLDLVHDPVGVCPFSLGRSAGTFRRLVTIHDAIAFRHPEGYSRLNGFLHRRYVPVTLRNVDYVLTVSQHAAADVRGFYGVAPERLAVVPPGVSPRFRPVSAGEAAPVARRHGLRPPYVLSVGAQQARKNLPRLLRGFARVRKLLPRHQLAIAGPTLWSVPDLWKLVESLGLSDAVAIIGYVPDVDLPALYSGASLFVFPSLYEGFGLPVLEAMACGTPVVCSNAASLPEVAGDAALLVDPQNEDDIAQGMLRALSDASLAAQLKERGFERAARFTWEQTAAKTVDAYKRAVASC